MQIVYAPGVWDMLHIGHINFLRRAKALGDKLIVGVQSDEFVEQQKGARPIISTSNRIAMVEALSCVDLAVPYDDYNYVEHADKVNADIFVLSEENRGADRFISIQKNFKTFFLPYDKSISTTVIKKSVVEQTNPWSGIWEKVAQSQENDHTVVGHHTSDVTWRIALYMHTKLKMRDDAKVLDYGCGAGLILKELDVNGFGIDISPTMIDRALKRYPRGTYVVSDHIPFKCHFDHIISWGVLHYLPNHAFVNSILEKMKSLSRSILIMEIPDIKKRNQRIKNRMRLGKIIDPEPLYFDREYFIKRGFRILTDDPKLTDNAKYSFSVIYDTI